MIVTLIAALAVPTLAMAGDKSYKCEMETQACLDMMIAKMKDRGWVGIEMDVDEEKWIYTIKRVVPGSPAEAADFQVGDVLVAQNGIKIVKENEKLLEEGRKGMKPGKAFTYTVSRGGKEIDLNVTLGSWPSDAMATYVGMHMIEHAKLDVAQK
jgi:predicted metalloprotease with PDZ domain